ncbi:hypothetical protein KJ359_001237 [Pestalotiopsis sp. 9143b]|nr:hypothetical protein KJ359_001237 [Pestalotiopsis sp. 9143b]
MSHKIEDYGLERTLLEKSYARPEFRYFEDYIGRECTWTHHQIRDPARLRSDLAHTYSVSPEDRAYIVRNIRLTEDSGEGSEVRLTDMRMWQMILDGYLHAGRGESQPLRWLCFYDIVNLDVRQFIDAEFRMQKGGVVAGAVEVAPESYSQGCPFVRSTLKLAEAIEELTEDEVHIKTIHLVSDGLTFEVGGERHMVFELGHQG